MLFYLGRFSALSDTLTVLSNNCINLLFFGESLEAKDIKDIDTLYWKVFPGRKVNPKETD